MDGANMNAQVGLTNPGFIGADVCHLNLHKTFASPHGGGGPGVGPICVARTFGSFPSRTRNLRQLTKSSISSSIRQCRYFAYHIRIYPYDGCRKGLAQATKIAILNANYLATCLKDTYGIVYPGS